MGGLERAGVRLHGLGVGIKVKGARGSWVDKLFGVGRELAGDGTSEGVQGEGQGLVLEQLWCRDGGRRAGEHPLGRGDDDSGARRRPGPAALLHLGRAEFSGGEAGGGEGDGLRTGSGESGGRLLSGEVGQPAAGRRRGGGV